MRQICYFRGTGGVNGGTTAALGCSGPADNEIDKDGDEREPGSSNDFIEPLTAAEG